MKFIWINRIIGGILLVSLLTLGLYQPSREYFLIPNHLVLFEGSQYSISKSLPVSAKTSGSSDGISLHDEQASITLGAEK